MSHRADVALWVDPDLEFVAGGCPHTQHTTPHHNPAAPSIPFPLKLNHLERTRQLPEVPQLQVHNLLCPQCSITGNSHATGMDRLLPILDTADGLSGSIRFGRAAWWLVFLDRPPFLNEQGTDDITTQHTPSPFTFYHLAGQDSVGQRRRDPLQEHWPAFIPFACSPNAVLKTENVDMA